MAKKRVSEFTSYIFIKNVLENMGWITKNPERNIDGEVYTQQECLDNVAIKEQLINLKPEYIVKVSEDKYYVIEAKSDLAELDKAYKEAKDYAEKINRSDIISAPIISGVAGNDEDGYQVKSAFLDNGEFKQINYRGKEITSLISKSLAQELVEKNSASIDNLLVDEKQLLVTAEEINEILHLGSINKDERASVMATLLLALIDDTKPNYNASPTVFVKDINSRAEEVLISHNKRDFFKHIEIKLPGKEEAQKKYKKSLVSTIFALEKINIKAAMNSGTDILGKFYEVFLKYGNGAKDIGIVLTPRHVAKFACEVLNITHNDLVYDPTCGTGGFLVSAFDYVREHSTNEQLKEFKKHRIFGVEQQPKIAALAIVNMIFRGDGSNNIVDNNCLEISLKKLILNSSKTAEYDKKGANKDQEPVNKVLMNPPFALKDKDEKEHKFIQHALEQMETGGLLFAIVPVSVLAKSGDCYKWRKNVLLKDNTLLSVITLPEKLFYPVGVHTCAMIVKKGIPHKKTDKVLWIRCLNDGYRLKKGVRFYDQTMQDDLEIVKNKVKLFCYDSTATMDNVPEFLKIACVDFEDKLLELVPEAYIDEHVPSEKDIKKGIEWLVRENAAFQIRNNIQEGERNDN